MINGSGFVWFIGGRRQPAHVGCYNLPAGTANGKPTDPPFSCRFGMPIPTPVLLQLEGVARISHALGRDAHDETLCGVADLLLKQTRGVNVVSRYDGGLFAVVMVGTSLGGARLYMERIRYLLSSTTFGHGQSVIPRFGSASLPENGARNGQDLFRQADRRLRTARSSRR